jgi:subfamily B ATP-binding cassette protein MsbA
MTGLSAAAIAAPDKKTRVPSPKPLAPLFERMRAYPAALVTGALMLVLSVAAGLAFPWVVKGLLDAAFVQKDAARLNTGALELIAIFLAQGIFNFIQVWTLTVVGERVVAQLRVDVFAHLVRLSPGFFAERRSGELTSRLSSDITLLQSVMTYQLTELLRQSLYLTGGIALLAYTNLRLTTTTLAIVPLVIGAALLFGRLLRRSTVSVQDRIADAMGMADEAFGNIRVVQSFTREQQ